MVIFQHNCTNSNKKVNRHLLWTIYIYTLSAHAKIMASALCGRAVESLSLNFQILSAPRAVNCELSFWSHICKSWILVVGTWMCKNHRRIFWTTDPFAWYPQQKSPLGPLPGSVQAEDRPLPQGYVILSHSLKKTQLVKKGKTEWKDCQKAEEQPSKGLSKAYQCFGWKW